MDSEPREYELDAGGMARVTLERRAIAGGPERVVAIKELHRHLHRDPAARARLRDEARITALIRHDNVVRVLDIDEQEGQLRIVMEYVRGLSLSEIGTAARRRGERMPPPHAAAILAGVLEGLHAAHETTDADGRRLAVVHRDVTPRNVLVGADGVPRLIDFGIVRAAEREAPRTRTGAAVGTPYYMAPEQVAGEALGPHTDVFLAGLVLWELLTGRRLTQEAPSEVAFIMMVVEGRIPTVGTYAPSVPAMLRDVVERALRTHPEERFASAAAMADAIRAAVTPSSPDEIGAWLVSLAPEALARRDRVYEATRDGLPPPAPDAPDEPTTETDSQPAWPPPDDATITTVLSAPSAVAVTSTEVMASPEVVAAIARHVEPSSMEPAPPTTPGRGPRGGVVAAIAAIGLIAVALVVVGGPSLQAAALRGLTPTTAPLVDIAPPASEVQSAPIAAADDAPMTASDGAPNAEDESPPPGEASADDRSKPRPAVRPASPPAGAPPPSPSLCRYVDDDGVKRLVACAAPACRRRGGACSVVQ